LEVIFLGLQKVISFFTGYIELLVRGAHVEKLLNLLTNSGLYLWDVKRLGTEAIQIKIRAHGFLRIRAPIRRTNSTVRIHRKSGLPFILRKLGRRKMFWIGALTFIVLLIYLSSFVFFIKVEGFAGQEQRILLTNLAKLGLKPGVLRQEILQRKSLIEREIMIHTPGAVWLGISIQGVVAEVKVIKRKNAPAPRGFCDIVAARDGVVSKMVVVRGMPVVKEGDTVARGDLLISGVEWLSDPEVGELFKREVSASGIVEAKVWHDLEVVEPKIIWHPNVKKAFFTEYKLRYGQKLWHLGSFGKKNYGNYYWSRWRRPIYQGRNPGDVVELIKDTWQTVNWRRVVRTRGEIEQAAMKEINQKLKKLSILSGTTSIKTWSEEGNFLKLTLTCETMEDISMISFYGKGQR
jgi:similar to stage IV sporulation protein